MVFEKLRSKLKLLYDDEEQTTLRHNAVLHFGTSAGIQS